MTKPTRRSKDKLVKNVVDYLKSDSYMYAPLISGTPSQSRASKMKKSSKRRKKTLLAVFMEFLKPDSYLFTPLLSKLKFAFPKVSEMKVGRRGLMRNIRDYLMADSFMYASLVAPQPVTPSSTGVSGSPHCVERINVEVTRKLTSTDNQANKSGNVTSDKFLSEKSKVYDATILGKNTLRHKDALKHMIRRSCRTSVTGRISNSQMRNLTAD